MRRADKEIVDRGIIDGIISGCDVCRVAAVKDNVPYIIPLAFAYDGESIFFHTAREGRKIEFFDACESVCFEFEDSVSVQPSETSPCKWSISYRSIIGYGHLTEITGSAEKIDILKKLMLHYSNSPDWQFNPSAIAAVKTWRIKITSVTGKQQRKR